MPSGSILLQDALECVVPAFIMPLAALSLSFFWRDPSLCAPSALLGKIDRVLRTHGCEAYSPKCVELEFSEVRV